MPDIYMCIYISIDHASENDEDDFRGCMVMMMMMMTLDSEKFRGSRIKGVLVLLDSSSDDDVGREAAYVIVIE
jgi:hypothetical protein